jgi:hypothetical protein
MQWLSISLPESSTVEQSAVERPSGWTGRLILLTLLRSISPLAFRCIMQLKANSNVLPVRLYNI